MEFHGLDLLYDQPHRPKTMTPDAFYKSFTRFVTSTYTDEERVIRDVDMCAAELQFLALNRPHYKIWPDVLPMLRQELPIRTDALKLPFPVFGICLPHGCDLQFADGRDVWSMLVTELPLNCKFVDDAEGNGEEKVLPALIIYTKTAKLPGETNPGYNWMSIPRLPDATFAEVINDLYFGGNAEEQETIKGLQRLVVSVCYLATGADRLMPDVLNADLAAYIQAQRRGNQQRIDKLERRAVKAGKCSWTIRETDSLRRVLNQVRIDEAHPTGPRGPLSESHPRRGFYRKLASGRTIFVRQTIVRPDLLPGQKETGYGLR